MQGGMYSGSSQTGHQYVRCPRGSIATQPHGTHPTLGMLRTWSNRCPLGQPSGHCSITCVTTAQGRATPIPGWPGGGRNHACADLASAVRTRRPVALRVGLALRLIPVSGEPGSPRPIRSHPGASIRCPRPGGFPGRKAECALPHHIRGSGTRPSGVPPAASRSNTCTVSTPLPPDPPGTGAVGLHLSPGTDPAGVPLSVASARLDTSSIRHQAYGSSATAASPAPAG